MMTATTAMFAGKIALSAMGQAIAALYGAADNINEFMDRHIAEMRRSDRPMIERTGRILEAAKLGFGLGYLSSVVVIAVGQLLLGNPLNAVGAVASAAIGTNPVAMTCAAFGAIYYGWAALSDDERNEIIDKVAIGLSIGVELLKAILSFVIKTAQEVMSSSTLKELSDAVSFVAKKFGRTLVDIARKSFDSVASRESVDAPHELRRSDQSGERTPSDVLRDLIASDRIGTSVLPHIPDSNAQ